MSNKRVKPGNGQVYYKATAALIGFFDESYIGGYSDIGRASGLAARTVAKAMKGESTSHATAKALHKAFREAGFPSEKLASAFVVV